MSPADEHFWALVEVLTTDQHVSRSTMMGLPCLRWDGAFFACLDRRSGDLVVKLAESRVNELICAGKADPFATAGRRFKQWAAIGVSQQDLWLTSWPKRRSSQAALTGEHRDAFDVVRQRERVEHPQLLNAIPMPKIQPDVARERRGLATDVDHPRHLGCG